MLDHSLSETAAVSDSVSARIIPFSPPFIHTRILDFTSLDGAPIAIPLEIEVWDPNSRRLPPGSRVDEDKSYFVLAADGEYKVQRNGTVVLTITISPPVPVFT